MNGRYAGRVALVTGGSRGIGLATAQRLADEGARVVITGRRTDSLDAAVEAIGPSRCLAVAGRSDDPEHRAETVDTTIAAYGALDLLVNNVGINPAAGRLLEVDVAPLRKTLEVNLLSTLGWVREALSADRTGGVPGAIVNVASVAGLRPATGLGFYGATKAALLHLTQQLAVELAPHTRVNAVAPAVVRTRFAGALFEGKEAETAQRYPLGRLGEPADVAAAIAYLGSEDAAWLTGQIVVLDGGLTLSGGV